MPEYSLQIGMNLCSHKTIDPIILVAVTEHDTPNNHPNQCTKNQQDTSWINMGKQLINSMKRSPS